MTNDGQLSRTGDTPRRGSVEDRDEGSAVARVCIETLLPGIDIRPFDIGPVQGAYDLRATYRDVRMAIEVKTLVDQALVQDMAAVPPYQPHSALTKWWGIELERGASFKQASRELPALLAKVERLGAGLGYCEVWDLFPHKTLFAALQRLRVVRMHASVPTRIRPPGIEIDITDGGVSTDDLTVFVGIINEAVERVAKESKLKKQLENAVDVDERHAFLVYPWHRFDGYNALRPDLLWQGTAPQVQPLLPEWLDGIWVTTSVPASKILWWSRSNGWTTGVQPGREGASSVS